MTTPQVKNRKQPVQRKAFTLVELMIVIVIIGILVGISAPFINKALIRAREFTIENEMLQLNASVERFETEYNFYPPSFNVPGGVTSAAEFRRYLNRIAPNNSESSSPGLQTWWNTVGRNLNEESGLVFWLSGLCTSKQYPLSGTAAIANSGMPLAPYNANRDAADTELTVTIDRNVFFDFELGRLTPDDDLPGIKSYSQPHGKGEQLAYLYVHSKSYDAFNAYHTGLDTNGDPNFFNPDTFQLIGPGIDGVVTIKPGMAIRDTEILSVTSSTGMDVDGDGILDADRQDDNITNFSGGRLDKTYE